MKRTRTATRGWRITALGMLSVGYSAGSAGAAPHISFHIEPQSLQEALTAFANQANLQLLFDVKEVGTPDAAVPALEGTYTTDEALQKLLSRTGLTYRFVNAHTIIIRPQSGTGSWNMNTGSTVMLRMAQATDSSSSASSASDTRKAETGTEPTASARNDLEEIIVTAQKREERLQEVPIPVTSLEAAALIDQNQLRLQDYYSSIPGLSYSVGPFGEPFIVIRGLVSNAYTSPTVGVTVDDVPYGPSTGNASGYTIPDIDPSDLQRVEVLRGPQGTLYGASSIGGLLKYVTVDPSTDQLSGRIQAGLDGAMNGEQTGYSVRGSVNVPLSQTLAVRASGFTRQDPGYVDNIETGQKGINEGKADGGRASLLWRPSQDFEIKLGALLQDETVLGSPNANPALGDLKQQYLLGTGRYDRKSQVYNTNILWKVGSVDITSITAYSVDSFSGSLDLSQTFGSPTALPTDLKTTKFSQEVRAAMPLGSHVDWLLGGFFTHENTPAEQRILAIDPLTGASVNTQLQLPYETTYQEYAVFTDLTVKLSDQFDVQVGGRESQNKQIYAQSESGPVSCGCEIPTVYSKGNAFTYLLTPRMKLSEELMLYARFSSGYRAGGPNTNSQIASVPPEFGPDKTQDYELGVKGSAFDRRLTFDASLYHIKWTDIQLGGEIGGLYSYTFNGGQAKSDGIEISVEARPINGMTVAAWLAFNDAKLTQDFPATTLVSGVFGGSGDRLPYGSRFASNFSLEQDFPIAKTWSGFVGAAVSYVGDREGDFMSTPQREEFPAYAKADLRAGVKSGSWLVNVFANNLTDRRGVLQGNLVSGAPPFLTYIQPRTIGMNISKSFQ